LRGDERKAGRRARKKEATRTRKKGRKWRRDRKEDED